MNTGLSWLTPRQRAYICFGNIKFAFSPTSRGALHETGCGNDRGARLVLGSVGDHSDASIRVRHGIPEGRILSAYIFPPLFLSLSLTLSFSLSPCVTCSPNARFLVYLASLSKSLWLPRYIRAYTRCPLCGIRRAFSLSECVIQMILSRTSHASANPIRHGRRAPRANSTYPGVNSPRTVGTIAHRMLREERVAPI